MVSSTPRPQFTPGKDPVPILEEAELEVLSLITKPNSKVQLGLPKMTDLFQAVEFQGKELHAFRNTRNNHVDGTHRLSRNFGK